MKIAIVTVTTTARRTGVAEILINLFDELQVIDTENQYYIFTSKDNRYMFTLTRPNFKEIVLPLTHAKMSRPIFHFWQIFILPIWCKFNGIDLIHLPNTLYVSKLFPTVSSILDVVELKTKKYSPIRTFFRKVMINSSIRNAKSIMTISESSASDLRELGATNVVPIHLGFHNPFLNLDLKNEAGILQKFKLTGLPYALFIGTLLKHKNIPTLIRAYSLTKKKNPSLKLVIVGAPDNDFNAINETIESLKLVDDVLLLSFVSQEEKLIILKNCTLFSFISSYEGFGIPILEAQAAGVPCISNDVSSLPEVGGKGVLLVSHNNLEKETAEAIQSLIVNSALREQLISLGKENLKRFSWEAFAKKTLETYTQFKKN